jgi:hypothetical protein
LPSVEPEIFKAYDVRGIYPDQIDEDVAYQVARAFARVLADGAGREATAGLSVAVGRDMRLSSPALAKAFREGLSREGCEVLDIGMVGTEMLYYAVGSRGLDGGACVTASHNPKQWAGFKLVREGAVALSGDRGIQDVRRLIEGEDLSGRSGEDAAQEEDIYEQFQHHVLGFIEPELIRPMEVVLDGGNGMAGPMIGPLIDSFPVAEDRLYFEPNGEFPGHEPNPLLEENRKLITEMVLDRQAELGIAWDGDGDRCFFIDDEGEFGRTQAARAVVRLGDELAVPRLLELLGDRSWWVRRAAAQALLELDGRGDAQDLPHPPDVRHAARDVLVARPVDALLGHRDDTRARAGQAPHRAGELPHRRLAVGTDVEDDAVGLAQHGDDDEVGKGRNHLCEVGQPLPRGRDRREHDQRVQKEGGGERGGIVAVRRQRVDREGERDRAQEGRSPREQALSREGLRGLVDRTTRRRGIGRTIHCAELEIAPARPLLHDPKG